MQTDRLIATGCALAGRMQPCHARGGKVAAVRSEMPGWRFVPCHQNRLEYC